MKNRKIYPYRSDLKNIARLLRNNSTLTEIMLWNELKGDRMMGYDFHRQKPLLNYVVDFFCHELELAIEVDGGSHDYDDVWVKDQARQSEIEALGIRFLRFTDDEIRKDMDNVLREIETYIELYEAGKRTLRE